MKIPLTIAKVEPYEGLIFTIATVRGPYYVFGGVKFYVDTGSSISFINEEDAKRINVPFKILDFKERTAVGGAPINSS